MIQRKQTLFLFQLVFFGVALLFISSNTVITSNGSFDVYLIPIQQESISSSSGHLVAIALNFIALVLTFVTIFLYKKRELQVKLCYVLLLLWLFVSLVIAFCPFVIETSDVLAVQVNYFTSVIGAFAILAAYFAARLIKKDIELLKSADRIR